jgi:cytochrome c-type biogenesis protein CcmH/NrfF
VALIFFVLWIAPYIALVIYIVMDVLTQTQKYTQNTESKELAESSREGNVVTIEATNKGAKDA